VAVNGLLDSEAGQSLVAAVEPLARPTTASDERSASQRRADALAELARRTLEGGRLPQSGGVRPRLLVTVELDSLLGPGGPGGDTGGPVPLDPEACRRLACDGAVTRVLVTRHPLARIIMALVPLMALVATPPTTIRGPMAGWRRGCGRRRPGFPRPLGARPASRWRWAGPAGW
jgi:Domain of unknown function (DUF222)